MSLEKSRHTDNEDRKREKRSKQEERSWELAIDESKGANACSFDSDWWVGDVSSLSLFNPVSSSVGLALST